MNTPRYEPNKIEEKWQRVWEDERALPHPESAARARGSERHWYQLEMLPYPSGTDMHMGHVLNYTMGDVVTHYKRRNGWTVVHPMGWDAFGLPAENAAIKEGGHPREITERNIASMRAQMKRLGWAIDWQREVSAHDPRFYRWTQWLFLKFFERDLAYRKEAPVNWCPNDQTVVANEYVVDGRCDRCGAEVELRNMTQWFFRITAYADELLEYDLPEGGWWPERSKTIQRNWIGRSEGAEILFRRRGAGHRPPRVHDSARHAVRRDVLRRRAGASVRGAARERRGARVREARRRPAGGGARGGGGQDGRLHRLPRRQSGQRRAAARVRRRLRADGVRHRRDHGGAGARRARPSVRRGIRPADRRSASTTTGVLVELRAVRRAAPPTRRSARSSSGCASRDAARLPSPTGCATGACRGSATGAARSRSSTATTAAWSRCRRKTCRCCCPDIEDYLPKGKPPLASNEEWLRVPCPRCGKEGRREADTMDTFADSSWYFLRYVDPRQRPGAVRPRHRGLLAARVAVHRRDRPPDRPPALLALLRQGAERHGHGRLPRAVRAPLPPGLGAAGRLEDVEVERECHGALGAGRGARRRRRAAVHPLPGAGRPGQGVERSGDRGDRPVPAPAVARRARGRRTGAARGERRPADAEGARDDREGVRRHRAARPVPHADLGGDGPGERPGGRPRSAGRPLRRGDRVSA